MATWHLGYHPSICSWTQGNQEKPASRWPAAGPSGPCPLDSSPNVDVDVDVDVVDDGDGDGDDDDM